MQARRARQTNRLTIIHMYELHIFIYVCVKTNYGCICTIVQKIIKTQTHTHECFISMYNAAHYIQPSQTQYFTQWHVTHTYTHTLFLPTERLIQTDNYYCHKSCQTMEVMKTYNAQNIHSCFHSFMPQPPLHTHHYICTIFVLLDCNSILQAVNFDSAQQCMMLQRLRTMKNEKLIFPDASS